MLPEHIRWKLQAVQLRRDEIGSRNTDYIRWTAQRHEITTGLHGSYILAYVESAIHDNSV